MTFHTLVYELGREQQKTTKELLDIATRHAYSEEAVGATFILGNAKAATNDGRTTPSKATIKGARKGAKGSKKGQKHRPWHVAVAASNGGGDKEADDPGEVYVMAVERDVKRQTQ
jgi:hypothetical protein